MSKKIRIMYAMGGCMKRAGAETVIMQYLRQLVHDPAFEFSILVHGKDKGDYDDELRAMGVPIYHAPVRGQHPFTYSREIVKLLREHPVDIIHCNMDNASGYFLKIAKDCGIPIRIAHSHTTRILTQNIIKRILGSISKKEIHYTATHRLACTQQAGDWLFGADPYKIVNNAIDLDAYKFSEEQRIKLRKELRIEKDAFLICHIGSFTYPKNHKGLLYIFKELKKVRPNSKLVLAGAGPMMEQIKLLAVELGIQDDTIFLGVYPNIPALLQAADAFVMPSLMEGLPVSGIEAQAAGIPCLFADTITSKICITPMAERIPLESASNWVERLANLQPFRDDKTAQCSLTKHGYNIKKEAEKLNQFYRSLL
jgi:glycosyltransferase involved in cell wall biosynthesis